MSVSLAVFAIILALYAFGCYRAGGFFGPFYQWKTHEEDPRHFQAVIFVYGCVSLILAALAAYLAVQGQ